MTVSYNGYIKKKSYVILYNVILLIKESNYSIIIPFFCEFLCISKN